MKLFRRALVRDSAIIFAVWLCVCMVIAGMMVPASAKVRSQAKPAEATPPVSSSLPILVVHEFAVAPDIAWPYTPNQVRVQLIASLKMKVGDKFNIVSEAPPGTGHDYVLQGEVAKWKAGNQAVRSFVGYGAGRETATIHYWVTDPSGEKVFDHTDTIRASYFSGVSSVGELAHPLADKVAIRLKEAKLH